MRDFIPQIEPWIDNSELIELKRVIDSTFVTENELTEEFEGMIRELTGSKYAISMTNGTAALFCCLKALGVQEGDEVIVPDMTFVATSNAVLMANATPIFCDIDKNTFCIDPKKIESLITDKTKAIIPVHLYGQSADMGKIMSIAKKYGLKVIEDAAQGVGVKFEDKHTGTFGDMGILSFYGNKTITCGEGGVILTDSKELRDKSYQLKNHGRAKKGTFKHEHIGYNFSFTEMQAAIGISQMKKLPKIIERKKEIHDTYVDRLKPLGGKLNPTYLDQRSSPVWWFTSFLTKDKKAMKDFLLEKGIQTRDFFYPLHTQPCYKYMNICRDFPVSERAYLEGISLPSSYGLSDEEQNYIIECIFSFYGR
jgi:perosamine synthetase|tara:strand:- start:11642 stop:12739 length:1098 start_codon:yes stop_codon:yes gene_type:complete